MDALLCPKLLEEELLFFLTVRFEICPQLQNVEGPLKNAPLKNPWLLVDYSNVSSVLLSGKNHVFDLPSHEVVNQK